MHLGAQLWYSCKSEKNPSPRNWCLFAYFQCQNGFAILSPSGCAKLTLTTGGVLLTCPHAPPHPACSCGARLHTTRSRRVAQGIRREAEWVCHLKDVKGDVPMTIKALLSAPPIINHFQNCSWLFNFFHLEDL